VVLLIDNFLFFWGNLLLLDWFMNVVEAAEETAPIEDFALHELEQFGECLEGVLLYICLKLFPRVGYATV